MKVVKKSSFILISALLSFKLQAQELHQNLRGTVLDKVSQTPIPGAVIQILNEDSSKVMSSDAAGNFQFKNLRVGKKSLKISYLGYKVAYLQNLCLNSGKE